MDFRSQLEKNRDHKASNQTQTDYKHMYEQVLAENQDFRAKLNDITSSHGELQARFADLLSQFEALKQSTQTRGDELLKMARNMEEMVATAYQQQGDLLTKYKDDLTRRLGQARSNVDGLNNQS